MFSDQNILTVPLFPGVDDICTPTHKPKTN